MLIHLSLVFNCVSWLLDISMVLCEAIACAQSCIHREELQLKPKQEGVLAHIFNGTCSHLCIHIHGFILVHVLCTNTVKEACLSIAGSKDTSVAMLHLQLNFS